MEILDRFGDVPDDRALLHQFGDVAVSGHITSAPVHLFVRWTQVIPSLKSVLPRIMPLVAKRYRSLWEGPRYSRAIAWLIVVAIAASGSAPPVVTARATQREARLVEMARPACDHTGTTNDELHHLVRYEYKVGASKKEALLAVVTLCMAKSGEV